MSPQTKNANTTDQRAIEDANPFAMVTGQELLSHHDHLRRCLQRAEVEYEEATHAVLAQAPHPIEVADIHHRFSRPGVLDAAAHATTRVSFKMMRKNGVSTLHLRLAKASPWLTLNQVADASRTKPDAVPDRWWQSLAQGTLLDEDVALSGHWFLTGIRAIAHEREAFLTVGDGQTASIEVQFDVGMSTTDDRLLNAAVRLKLARHGYGTAAQLLSVADAADPCDAFVSLLRTVPMAEFPHPTAAIPQRCLWAFARSDEYDLVNLAVMNPGTDTGTLAYLLQHPDRSIQARAVTQLIERMGSPYVNLWDPDIQSQAFVAATSSPTVREHLDFTDPHTFDGVLCDSHTGSVLIR